MLSCDYEKYQISHKATMLRMADQKEKKPWESEAELVLKVS